MLIKKTGKKSADRREFLKLATGATLALGAGIAIEDEIAFASQEVNRASSPSELRITDMRFTTIARAPMRCPIIRIDTNQGISGWGEVRDGASVNYALMLKSRLLDENPCNVERIFKKIKQFGGHGRQGGGVSGVEMALWDLAGKAFGVPVYQMLGGRYRDRIRMYCDTVQSDDPVEYAERMRKRVEMGFTFLKMDLGAGLVEDIPGCVTKPLGLRDRDIQMTQHPFTGMELTEKGCKLMAEYVAKVRDVIGYEVPLAADHFGHIGVNSCIRLGQALEPFQLAWLEDMVPWQFTDLWKEISESVSLPTLTGEDIYLKEDFIKLIDAHAVDIVHPDLATSGGILESKKISDYAEEHGVGYAMHFAGTPISCLANIHSAAASQNFLALEHHSVDVDWWESLVTGFDGPMLEKGFIRVPNKPGLGVELNEEVAREHSDGKGFFEPTDDWNERDSWDRTWS